MTASFASSLRTSPTQAATADAIARALKEGARIAPPALSLAVVRSGGLLWAEAYGTADLELDVVATTTHLFRLGSVSKAVTATAAAKLACRGVLDLDAPISMWLRDLPEPHRATTTRQLLTHRGGVRHYLPKDFDRHAPGGTILHRAYAGRDEILALFIDDPLVAAPGTQVSYSSFGYTLASFVVEAAAGTGFLDLIRDEIALPFGLASLRADDVLAVIPGRVSGYYSAQEFEFAAANMPDAVPRMPAGPFANIVTANPAFCWAGAGLLMSMPDLARFGAAHLEGAAARIDNEERALLFTPQTEASASSPPLGLGWRVDRDAKSRRRWHHAGATSGGRASLVVYPDLGLSIALASNTMATPGDVLGPSADLADAFA